VLLPCGGASPRNPQHVRDIADLLSRLELKDFGLQITERNHLVVRAFSRSPVDPDQDIVGRTSAHLFFELGQSRTRQ
jgi:hypothetical protein